MIVLIRPWEVDKIAPLVIDDLKMALVHSYEHSVEGWLDACKKDMAQLWVGPDCVAVTEIRESNTRVLHALAVAGERMDEWIDELVALWRDFAREAQCAVIIAVGRPGWRREFRRQGFELTHITGILGV